MNVFSPVKLELTVADQIKCVLFDLDNTLVGIPNTWVYFDRLIIDVLEHDYGLPVPPSEKRDTLWRSGKEFESILRGWGIPAPKQFWTFFDRRDALHRTHLIETNQLVLYPDVLPALERLTAMGIPLGIVTNTPVFIAEPELEAFHLSHYFSKVVGLGDNQEQCKPEPYGILLCLEELGVPPANAMFVGDSSVDIEAAARAEVLAVLIDRDAAKKARRKNLHLFKYTPIESLSEIFNLL